MNESDLPSYGEAFAAVRAASKRTGAEAGPYSGDEVDTAALLVTRKCRSLISAKVALSWDEWTQLTAQIQVEVARAIRHTAYEPPPFPGKLAEPRYMHQYTRETNR